MSYDPSEFIDYPCGCRGVPEITIIHFRFEVLADKYKMRTICLKHKAFWDDTLTNLTSK